MIFSRQLIKNLIRRDDHEFFSSNASSKKFVHRFIIIFCRIAKIVNVKILHEFISTKNFILKQIKKLKNKIEKKVTQQKIKFDKFKQRIIELHENVIKRFEFLNSRLNNVATKKKKTIVKK